MRATMASLSARVSRAGMNSMTSGSALSRAKGSRSASDHCRSQRRSVRSSIASTAEIMASRGGDQRSIIRICCSVWWSPAAGVMLVSLSTCSAVSSTPSAAVFSSTRATRLVPGIGAMSSPWASSQASATCAGVAPTSAAMASTSSTTRRLRSKFSPVNRGLVLRESLSSKSSVERIVAGEEPAAQRRVGHEPDAELAQQRQHLRLGVARPQRVLRLQRGDRVDGVGAADRVRPGLGQADVADLALGDELGQGADGVLDRRVRVDAVLVVEVDVVGAEPLQRTLDRGADVRGTAVEVPRAAAGVGDEAELRRQHDLVAAVLDGAADEFLVGVRPVDLGGVDERDAQVERPVDRADRLGVVGARAGVGRGHPHGAQADPGHIEISKLDVFHRCSFDRSGFEHARLLPVTPPTRTSFGDSGHGDVHLPGAIVSHVRRLSRGFRECACPTQWISTTVSTVGLESSPVAPALAGLRANEARYFKNKYDHVFTVEPAAKAKETIDWVHRILEEERDIVIASPPLEATAFQVENIRMAYVFYESGLSINVMYTDRRPQEAGRRVQALRRDGGPRGARLAVQVRRGRSRSWPARSAARTS